MSGYSYEATCPNCESEMSCSNDNRPFEIVSGTCLECGFYYFTKAGYSSLEELNEERANRELESLKELPKQEFNF